MEQSPRYTACMVRWKLGNFLEQHKITPYRLSEETRGRISRNAIYEIARSDTKQVKFETLDVLITVLRHLTGARVELSDLLEYVPDASTVQSKN